MSVLTVLHDADLHLDSPFDSLPGDKARIRREEQRKLLMKIASAAIAAKADLVLLSGDLLDSGEAFSETGDLLARALASVPCPVFISPANHDYYTESSPYAKLFAEGRVHVFQKQQLESVKLPELGVRVYGAAFTDRICPPLLENFRAQQDGLLNLLCIHGEVTAGRGRYNPVTEQQLAASGLDWAAFGHVHQASGLKKAGSCFYSWPGCPEGRGFDETGDRFVDIVKIDRETRAVTLNQVSVALRRCVELEADVSGGEALLAVHRLLPDDTEKDLYRIRLTGECETWPDVAKLYENLEGLFFHLEIADETRLRRDVWEKAGEDTLRGIFLRKLRERYDAAGDEEKRLIEQAARFGLAALENSEVPDCDT